MNAARTTTPRPTWAVSRRTTTDEGSSTLTEGFDTTGEALAVYMNETRDLLDAGFALGTPEGVFPNTSFVARKGRTSVLLSVRPVA